MTFTCSVCKDAYKPSEAGMVRDAAHKLPASLAATVESLWGMPGLVQAILQGGDTRICPKCYDNALRATGDTAFTIAFDILAGDVVLHGDKRFPVVHVNPLYYVRTLQVFAREADGEIRLFNITSEDEPTHFQGWLGDLYIRMRTEKQPRVGGDHKPTRESKALAIAALNSGIATEPLGDGWCPVVRDHRWQTLDELNTTVFPTQLAALAAAARRLKIEPDYSLLL